MSIAQDFKTFITQGNVIQIAVAFIIGAAFTAVVTAFVADLATPLIGVAAHIDFSTWTYTLNGSTFRQGAFLNAIISFILVALVVFFGIVQPVAHLEARAAAKKAAAAPTQKECPYCKSKVDITATRCAFCTSNL
ncbi:MAG: large conductance mechanosensitive channel protein MscL [Thermoplasmata archaeon]|nr:large conductance mechanosensitive channel protein MscL [Thermoplasmata archaeon]